MPREAYWSTSCRPEVCHKNLPSSSPKTLLNFVNSCHEQNRRPTSYSSIAGGEQEEETYWGEKCWEHRIKESCLIWRRAIGPCSCVSILQYSNNSVPTTVFPAITRNADKWTCDLFHVKHVYELLSSSWRIYWVGKSPRLITYMVLKVKTHSYPSILFSGQNLLHILWHQNRSMNALNFMTL